MRCRSADSILRLCSWCPAGRFGSRWISFTTRHWWISESAQL